MLRFYLCKPCAANKTILNISKLLLNILDCYAMNLLSMLQKKLPRMRFIYLDCREYMKTIIRTITNNNFFKKHIIFLLYLFSSRCIAMHCSQATTALNQEFQNSIALSQSPNTNTIENFLSNNANPNIIIKTHIIIKSHIDKKTTSYTPLIYACLQNN